VLSRNPLVRAWSSRFPKYSPTEIRRADDQQVMSQNERVISLKDLYKFVTDRRHGEEAIRIDRGSLPGKEYCHLCDRLADVIDEAQGFYLWGKYDERGYWHSIYLGKAGFGETKSLKKRIREELKDERCCFWRSVLDETKLHEIRERIHNGKYERSWKRAMKKAGTTHIVWEPAPAIAPENITRVEADLIEALNPKANLQRPTPTNTVQNEATRIFEGFRRTIHAARGDKFKLSLAGGGQS
jgi:hypothetical protein